MAVLGQSVDVGPRAIGAWMLSSQPHCQELLRVHQLEMIVPTPTCGLEPRPPAVYVPFWSRYALSLEHERDSRLMLATIRWVLYNPL